MAPTILIVEDNPITRKMLRLVLESEGYRVIEAADARAALAAVAASVPDLVLQDLILPDMDGIELLRQLRSVTGAADLPILALSGFLGRLEESQTAAAGFTARLVKPIEPRQLVDSIRGLVPLTNERQTTIGAERHVLIVDDDPVQLKLARLHFSQYGFVVALASNPADALAAARAQRPDAILSDVYMPEVDGFQFCLTVRQDPELRQVPIVLMSSQYSSVADRELAARVGANALVPRTSDFDAARQGILDAIATGVSAVAEPPSERLKLEHAQLVIEQLERQSQAQAGLSQRCALQAAQLALLSGIADALTRQSDTDVVLRDVLGATLDAAGISKGALVLKNASGQLQARQSIGFSDAEREQLQKFFDHPTILADVVERAASLSIPSAQMSAPIADAILEAAHVATMHVVSLTSGGRGVGALVIGATRTDVTSDDAVAFARAMGNQIVQSLELTQSLSERRHLEEQLLQAQKMEAIGRLAGGVAHDFNNLLSAILGHCELLLEDVRPNDPSRKDIGEIQKAGMRAAALTRQLLAFSRKQIIEPTLLDLGVVVTGMQGLIERLIGEDVTVAIRLHPDLALVKADRGQVEQVIMNFVVNARDAMVAGGVLTIETANVELIDDYASAHFAAPAGRHVVLTITDTGIGMTPDVQTRLFEPFFTTKEQGKGTGLGLATVYGIVTRSGGSIGVYSEVGRGTSFKVYFPCADALDVAPVAPPPAPRLRSGMHTVLVVEDEAGLRELTRRLLERQGYRVLLAANAEEALRRFEEHPSIDVLLTDVVMPGASGPELTQRVMIDRPGLSVIYMSGYTEEAIVRHGVLEPGIAFLHKPFTSETLGRKISEVVER